jgi:hypothetical protein
MSLPAIIQSGVLAVVRAVRDARVDVINILEMQTHNDIKHLCDLLI